MIDLETREILQTTLEHLKTQMTYVRNLHESLVLLVGALNKELPSFERTHRAEFQTVLVENSWQQSQLAEIDALLQRLAIPQVESE
jgi:hypothetical protein